MHHMARQKLKEINQTVFIDKTPLGGYMQGYEISVFNRDVKCSWACRILDHSADHYLDTYPMSGPRVGDVAVFRVEHVGNHSGLVTFNNMRLRLYKDDLFMGVFGNRYATDAFEAEVEGLDKLHLVTGGGMVGTVKSKHSDVKDPTVVSIVGFVNKASGGRVNLKYNLRPEPFIEFDPGAQNIIAIVGTGMNSGKTTAVSKLIKGASELGLKVAACKLTGSVSHRDQYEMRAASASKVLDFSEYGFPSTYLCTRDELMGLCYRMLADLCSEKPDVIFMEIADGILQRETEILIKDPAIKNLVQGFVLTAESAPSALFGVNTLNEFGHKVAAVSGKLTSSPLSVKEFKSMCSVPVGPSTGSGKKIAEIVRDYISGARNA